MAAVLAAGPGAVLSHHSAATLWELRPSSRGAIDVIAQRGKRGRPGIRLHRIDLPPDEITTHRGIPVTTPSRTISDLAGELTKDRAERAISELERLRLPDPVPLHDLLTRHPHCRGSKLLRQLLVDFEPTLTRRELEHRFRAFLATTNLPRPLFNEPLDLGNRQITPDCLWLSHRLIVELDGRDTHARRLAFESDRARDRAATVAGYRVIGITWRQLRDEPHAIAADLSELLLAV